MIVVDLDGKEIEVNDLTLALMQADDYRHYRVNSPSTYQLHLYDYWEDLYQKLLLLDVDIKGIKDGYDTVHYREYHGFKRRSIGEYGQYRRGDGERDCPAIQTSLSS